MESKHIKNLFGGTPVEALADTNISNDIPQSSAQSSGSTTLHSVDTFGYWTPCAVRLPEMHDAGMLKRSGINQISDICIVTIMFTDGTTAVDSTCRLRDGEWYSEKLHWISASNKKYEITAWMPLPESYKG